MPSSKRKPSPAARMQLVLQALVSLLDKEYRFVYSHNLGVQSGTSVMEDVQVQRVRALCSRIAAMVAHESAYAEALIAVCKAMSPARLNRMQTVFDSLDMEHVTDFVRLSMFDSSDIFRQTPQAARALAQSLQPVTQPLGGCEPHGAGSSSDDDGHGAVDMSQSHATSRRTSQRGATCQMSSKLRHAQQLEAPEAMRYERLRAAGHPFVRVADKLLKVRNNGRHGDAITGCR
jgi:hypothetical protein